MRGNARAGEGQGVGVQHKGATALLEFHARPTPERADLFRISAHERRLSSHSSISRIVYLDRLSYAE